MRLLVSVLLCLVLTSAGLPLAVAPPSGPPLATPSCPQPIYPDTPQLLTALAGASYACAEELATALRDRVGPPEVASLLALVRNNAMHSLARRNALRVLGRLAASPRGSRAHELMLRSYAAEVRATLEALLYQTQDSFLLQDAIWMLDSFFYPAFSAAAALEELALAPGPDPALRYRAANARTRLIFARAGLLAPDDLALLEAGLRADDPGVRAAAATAISVLRPARLDPPMRAALEIALAGALAAEPPLSLAPDAPDFYGDGLSGLRESNPTSLTARAAIARAQDQLAGDGPHLAQLRSAYEALALPEALDDGTILLRAGLPSAELPALRDEMLRVQAAFAQIVGPELALPLADEGGRRLTVLIFARQGLYRDYMRAFTPFSIDVDGTYDETTATLYTHARSATQSSNTLTESLRHELAHHLAATHLFPGHWQEPGYHSQPKGWADEGLAELLAGLSASGPAPRPAQLARLCARPLPPRLAELLSRRAGYDQFGSFDYDSAWAFTAYLVAEQPTALRHLYAAYRTSSYRLDAWAALAGLSLTQAEAGWHAALQRWCDNQSLTPPHGLVDFNM